MKLNKFIFLFSLIFFNTLILTPKIVHAEEAYTTFSYTVKNSICTFNSDGTYNITETLAVGATCITKCGNITLSSISDSNGQCIIKFPKSECDIGSSYIPDIGKPVCGSGGNTQANWYVPEPYPILTTNQLSSSFFIWPDQTPTAVPEFSLLTAILTIFGSGGLYYVLRKRSLL